MLDHDHDEVVKWVLGLAVEEQADTRTDEFVRAANAAWPRVLACTRRAVPRQFTGPEISSLALEIWEIVLRSVWKTLNQSQDGRVEIQNLQNYLVGAFHHRLNEYLKKERCRGSVIELLPPEELAALEEPGSAQQALTLKIHQQLQLVEVYSMMDEEIRRAMIARIYGFSWREIARTLGIKEQNLIMRIQYAVRKIREKFAEMP